MRIRTFVLCFPCIVGLCWAFELNPYFNYTTFENLTSALYKDVEFMAQRLDQMNIDAVFGLTLAEANLAMTLSSLNINSISRKEWNYIVHTKKLCNSSRVYVLKKLLKEKNFFLKKLLPIIAYPEIWMSKISWRHGSLKTVVSSGIRVTLDSIRAFMFSGTPQENKSDYCLLQLIGDNCQVSNTCIEMLIKDDKSRGYPLAHRLIFIKTAAALNCHIHHIVNFSMLSLEYCQQILQDLVDLETMNFPPISRDLIMEQITLCGMEGYLEFINEHYADLITSWQYSEGCYTSLSPNQQNNRIHHKRSTNPMDYGCDSHASGVAASTLSLLIREYVENRLSPIHEIDYY